jgi:CheY-like chemotaxis protein
MMSKSKTVLIIDDDSDFVRAIKALLESSGYEVRSAVNGREGVQVAKAIEPDLILLDVMMSERTEGFFALQEMRRIPVLDQTPVIVMSSIYSDEKIFRVDPEAGWLPANLFLPKPVEPTRLLTEVNRLTGQSAAPEAKSAARRQQ